MNTVNVVFSHLICHLIWFPVIVISSHNLAGLRLDWLHLGDDIGARRLGTCRKHWDVYHLLPLAIWDFTRRAVVVFDKSVACYRIKNVGIIFWQNSSQEKIVTIILFCLEFTKNTTTVQKRGCSMTTCSQEETEETKGQRNGYLKVFRICSSDSSLSLVSLHPHVCRSDHHWCNQTLCLGAFWIIKYVLNIENPFGSILLYHKIFVKCVNGLHRYLLNSLWGQ